MAINSQTIPITKTQQNIPKPTQPIYFFICLFYTGYKMNFSYIYFYGLALIFLHLFIFQILKLDIKNEKECLNIFKSNNFLGFLVFINILLGKIII